MSCFECFTTSFKHYHFDNFTFAHSRRNTLEHPHHLWSFSSRHPLTKQPRRHSTQITPTRSSHGRTRLARKGTHVRRPASLFTVGPHSIASNHSNQFQDRRRPLKRDSNVQRPASLSTIGSVYSNQPPPVPSPLSREVIYEESRPTVSSILNSSGSASEAPKAPKRVSFAHVTVQRHISSNISHFSFVQSYIVMLTICEESPSV